VGSVALPVFPPLAICPPSRFSGFGLFRLSTVRPFGFPNNHPLVLLLEYRTKLRPDHRIVVDQQNTYHYSPFDLTKIQRRGYRCLKANARRQGYAIQLEPYVGKGFLASWRVIPDHSQKGQLYPCTLILEKESTARDEMGCPIDIAGRNVVKISIRFSCGRSSCEAPGSERIL